MSLLEVLTTRGGVESQKAPPRSDEDAHSGEFKLTFEEELGHLCSYVVDQTVADISVGDGGLHDVQLAEAGSSDASALAAQLSFTNGDFLGTDAVADVVVLAAEIEGLPQSETTSSTSGVVSGGVKTELIQAGVNHSATPSAGADARIVTQDQTAFPKHSGNVPKNMVPGTVQSDESLLHTIASGTIPIGAVAANVATESDAVLRRQSGLRDGSNLSPSHPSSSVQTQTIAQNMVSSLPASPIAESTDKLMSQAFEVSGLATKQPQTGMQDSELAAPRAVRNQMATPVPFVVNDPTATPQQTNPMSTEHFRTTQLLGDPTDIVPIREAAMPSTSASPSIATIVSAGPQTTSAAPVEQILNQISVIEDKSSSGVLEVRLDPEELGKVRLSFITRETGLVVSVFAERPETLELLRRHADELQLGLSDMNFEGAGLEFSSKQGESDGELDDEMDASANTHANDTVGSRHVVSVVADDRLDIRL